MAPLAVPIGTRAALPKGGTPNRILKQALRQPPITQPTIRAWPRIRLATRRGFRCRRNQWFLSPTAILLLQLLLQDGALVEIRGQLHRSVQCIRNAGSNRRLEFELGAWFEGSCGFALVLALSQMMEHGLGPFGRADLHPRRTA